jgi:hypothetical protein
MAIRRPGEDASPFAFAQIFYQFGLPQVKFSASLVLPVPL